MDVEGDGVVNSPRPNWLCQISAVLYVLLINLGTALASFQFLQEAKFDINGQPQVALLGFETTAMQLLLALMLPNIIYGFYSILIGFAADFFNPRPFYFVGNLLTFVASILFYVRPTWGSLIAARIIMAFGESFLLPQSLSILGGAMQDPWGPYVSVFVYIFVNIEVSVLAAIFTNLWDPTIVEYRKDVWTFVLAIGVVTFALQFVGFLDASSEYASVRPFGSLPARVWRSSNPFKRGLITMAMVTNLRTKAATDARNQALLLRAYAPTAFTRLSPFRFDYCSTLFAGLGLATWATTLGAIGWGNAAMSDQHFGSTGVGPLTFLSILAFAGTLCFAISGGLAVLWKQMKNEDPNAAPNNAAPNAALNPVFTGHSMIPYAWSFFNSVQPHVDRIQDLQANANPANFAPIRAALREIEDASDRAQSLQSYVWGLLSLMFALVGFYTCLTLMVELIKAEGYPPKDIIPIVFVSTAIFWPCALVHDWLKQRNNHQGSYVAPRLYLAALGLLTTIMVMPMIYCEPSKSVWYLVSTFWGLNIISIFYWNLTYLTEEMSVNLSLPTAVFSIIFHFAYMVSLALQTILENAIAAPTDAEHPEVYKSQCALGVVTTLFMTAMLISLLGINPPKARERNPGAAIGGVDEAPGEGGGGGVPEGVLVQFDGTADMWATLSDDERRVEGHQAAQVQVAADTGLSFVGGRHQAGRHGGSASTHESSSSSDGTTTGASASPHGSTNELVRRNQPGTGQ